MCPAARAALAISRPKPVEQPVMSQTKEGEEDIVVVVREICFGSEVIIWMYEL